MRNFIQKTTQKAAWLILTLLCVLFAAQVFAQSAPPTPYDPQLAANIPLARMMANGGVHLSWNEPSDFDPDLHYFVVGRVLTNEVPPGSGNWQIDRTTVQIHIKDTDNSKIKEGSSDLSSPDRYLVHIPEPADTGKYYYYFVLTEEKGTGTQLGNLYDSAPIKIDKNDTIVHFYVDTAKHGGDPEFSENGQGWRPSKALKHTTTTLADIYVDFSDHSNGLLPEDIKIESLGFQFSKPDGIFETITNQFGMPDDIDGNGKIIILMDDFPNLPLVGGYFLDINQLPMATAYISNVREMLTITYVASDDAQTALLAHELQHLIHYAHDTDESSWVNEGASVLAEDLIGKTKIYWASNYNQSIDDFIVLKNGKKSLFDPVDPQLYDYGVSGAFALYMHTRLGEIGYKGFINDPNSGVFGFATSLPGVHSFQNIFADWAITNYLNPRRHKHYKYDSATDPAFYAYDSNNLKNMKVSPTIFEDKFPSGLLHVRHEDDLAKLAYNAAVNLPLQATYWQWEAKESTPTRGALGIRLRDVDDLPNHKEVALVRELSSGEIFVKYFDAKDPIEIMVDDFGTKPQKVTLIVNNAAVSSSDPGSVLDNYEIASYLIPTPVATVEFIVDDKPVQVLGKKDFGMQIKFDEEMEFTGTLVYLRIDPQGPDEGEDPFLVFPSWYVAWHPYDEIDFETGAITTMYSAKVNMQPSPLTVLRWDNWGPIYSSNTSNYEGEATFIVYDTFNRFHNFNKNPIDIDPSVKETLEPIYEGKIIIDTTPPEFGDGDYEDSFHDNLDPNPYVVFETEGTIPVSNKICRWLYIKVMDWAGNENVKYNHGCTVDPEFKAPPKQHPDDNYSLSDSTPPPFTPDPSAEVAILGNGLFLSISSIMTDLGVPYALATLPLTLEQLKQYRVLVVPSAGFKGLEDSQSIKDLLQQYVEEGGVIFSLSQDRGYEFDVLPGSWGGAGYSEEEGCVTYAGSMETPHPIFAGQTDRVFDANADGYFSAWPDGATILSRRVKNSMPMLIEYPLGQGKVLASTLFSDYGHLSGQINDDEKILIRDILQWGLNGQAPMHNYVRQLPVVSSLDIIDSFPVTNDTASETATVASLELYDPNGLLLTSYDQSLATPLEPQQTASINASFTTPNADCEVGIYRWLYQLKDAEGNLLGEKTTLGRFAVSLPYLTTRNTATGLRAVVRPASTVIADGAATTIDVIVYNDTDQDSDITLDYGFLDSGFAEYIWTDGQTEFKSSVPFSSQIIPRFDPCVSTEASPCQSLALTPGAVPAHDSRVFSIQIPSVKNHGATRPTLQHRREVNSQLPIPFYGDPFVRWLADSNEVGIPFKVRVNGTIDAQEKITIYTPTVATGVATDKAEYLPTENGTISFSITNQTSGTYEVSARLQVLDPDYQLLAEEIRQISLTPDNVHNGQMPFTVGNKSGSYIVLLEVSEVGGTKKIGSASTFFQGVGAELLSVAPQYPSPWIVGAGNQVSFAITNMIDQSLAQYTVESTLFAPDGQTVAWSDTATLSNLNGGETRNTVFDVALPAVTAGVYRMHTVVTTLGIAVEQYMDFTNDIVVQPTLDKTSYKAGETVQLAIDVVNNGVFVGQDVTVDYAIAGFGFNGSRTVNLTDRTTINDTFLVPETAGQGNYAVSAASPLVAGDPSIVSFTIRPSSLSVRFEQTTANSGDPLTVFIDNTGGVMADFDLSLEIYDDKGLLIASKQTSASATAGGTATDMISVPAGVVSGNYSLLAQCTNQTNGGTLSYLNKRITVTGLAGSLQVATGQKSYHSGNAMNILSGIENTSDQSIDGASLQLRVYGSPGDCSPPSPPADADPSMIPDLQLCSDSGTQVDLWSYENGPTVQGRTLVLVYETSKMNGNDYTLRSSGLTSLRIPYTLKAISGLYGSIDLSLYTHIVIPSDGTNYYFYQALNDNMDKLTAWVEAGGHLYFSAPCANSSTGFRCWDSGPGGLTSSATALTSGSNENYIQTPQHPIVDGLTDNDLRDWIFTDYQGQIYQSPVSKAHFTNLPPNTVTILSDDAEGLQPTMIEYPLGSGLVVASTNNFTIEGWGLLKGWLAYRNLDWKISNVDSSLLSVSFDPTTGIMSFRPHNNSTEEDPSPPPVYGSDQVLLTFTDSNGQTSSKWITVNVAPDFPSGNMLWEQTLPVALVDQLNLDTPFDISQFITSGKFYVEGILKTSLGQVVARDIDSFYVIDSALGVTLETGKEVYTPDEPVEVTATVTNNTGVAETGLNFTLAKEGIELSNQVFDLAPGATRTFTVQTSDVTSFELTAAVKDVLIKDTVRVEEPSVYMAISGPDVVGLDPFDLYVELRNDGTTDASLSLDFAGENCSILLPAGQMKTISKTFSIIDETTFAIVLSGDVALNEEKIVSLGFLPNVLLYPRPIYPTGTVAVPFTVDNVGELGADLDLSFTLTEVGGNQRPVAPRTIFVAGHDQYGDSLYFENLAPGSYQLAFNTVLASGSVSFTVAVFNSAVIDGITVGTSLQVDGTLPVTVTVRNTGANNFIGDLQLFTGFFVGSQLVTIDAGQSIPVGFNIPAPSAGSFTANASLRYNQLEIDSRQLPFSLQPRFAFVSLPANHLYQAGQDYALLFTVANSGPVGGRVTLDLSDTVIGCQHTEWLAPGEQQNFMCQIRMPDDILSSSQEANLSLLNLQSSTVVSQPFPYQIEGYDLEVAIETDKACYNPGDMAEVTLSVTNNNRNALAGDTLVSMNGYYSKQPALFGGKPVGGNVDMHSSPGDLKLPRVPVFDLAQVAFDSNHLTLTGGTGNSLAWTYDQNGDIWVMYTATKILAKFDGATGALVKSIPMSGNSWGYISQIAVDADGRMYAGANNGNIIRIIDPETGFISSLQQTPNSGSVVGVFWDGQYLWVGEKASTGKWFHRVDVSGGGWTIINSFFSPSTNISYAIAVIGDLLLMSAGTSDSFYVHTNLDFENNTISATFQTSADFGGGTVGSFAIKGNFLQRKQNNSGNIRNYTLFGEAFASTGDFTSNVIDLGLTSGAAITVDSTLPAATAVILETRTGDTTIPGDSWSAWETQISGQQISSPAASYLQYRITLNSTDGSVTPVVHGVTIEAPTLVKSIEHSTLTDFESMPVAITNWVPVQFTGSKLFYGVYAKTGYAIHLNSIWLCESGQGLDIYPDRQIYNPGETVTVHLQPHEAGSLDLAGPGLGQSMDIQDISPFSVDFVLPSTMVQGTYPITAIFNGVEYATSIDVAGLAIYLDMIMLDKKVYAPDDTMYIFAFVSSSDAVSGVTAVGGIISNSLFHDSFEVSGLSLNKGLSAIEVSGAMPAAENGFAQLYIDLYKEVDGDPHGMLLTSGIKAFDVVANTAPVVTLTSPTGGETLSGAKTISFTASDPEGDALSFLFELSCDGGANWQIIYPLIDPTGVMSWDTTAIADASACLLQVVVSDGEFVATDRSTAFAIANNLPPVADVGVDQNAEVGTPVTLDGSNSFDPNFWDTISFLWGLTSKPADSQLTNTDIAGQTTPKPAFTPDSEGDFVLTLTVTDLSGANSFTSTTVTANWIVVPPNADAGVDQNVAVGDQVSLNGGASNDPDNFPSPLLYKWTLIGYPPDTALTNADIIDNETAHASIQPDVPGSYSLNLNIADGVASDNDQVVIHAEERNVPPNAAAGNDFESNLGEQVVVNGLGSNDPDAGPAALSYAWRFISVPVGSVLTSAAIVGPNTAAPSFSPDVAGDYVIELAVNDGEASAFDNVVVKVIDNSVCEVSGDLDGDCDVDRLDVNIITALRNKPASVNPACDLDQDGKITILDARKLTLMCTYPNCAVN